jgi:hypothetical protein
MIGVAWCFHGLEHSVFVVFISIHVCAGRVISGHALRYFLCLCVWFSRKNVSVIVRFGLCCVECYLFVCYVAGFVCLVRCVASCEC